MRFPSQAFGLGSTLPLTLAWVGVSSPPHHLLSWDGPWQAVLVCVEGSLGMRRAFLSGSGTSKACTPSPHSLHPPRLGLSYCASWVTASRELTRLGKTRQKLPAFLPGLLLPWQLHTHLPPSSPVLPLRMVIACDTFLSVPKLLKQRQG